jgi:signal transduction histidine kinase
MKMEKPPRTKPDPKLTSPDLEAFISQNQSNLKTIFDEINIGILFVNRKKRNLLFANRFFYSLVNTKEEMVLKNIHDYADANINRTPKLNISQDLHIQDNGHTFLLGFSIYGISDGIIAVLLREIGSKSIYIQSRQDNEFFDKVSELVAEIAHEMGNPLSGISMSLQVLQQNVANWPQEKVNMYIERTINEINRLAVFLKRIRDISNENKLEMKTINLKSVIDDLYHQNQEMLKQKKIRFRNMVEDELWISIDEVAFFQIMLNLLKNSLQILKHSNVIRIYVESIDEYYIKLVYRNNGPLIPDEFMEKIFSPFYTTKERGGGIGLSISLKLMTRMGGTIRAEHPDDGKGAKFGIYIPNKAEK